MTISVQSLPAGEGDALWIEWGQGDEVRRMIIDMGRKSTGERIREKLEALPEAERAVELLVITHVDRDHIEGVLEAFVRADKPSSANFKEIWFNGWNHLHAKHYSDEPPSYDEQAAAAAEEQLVGGHVQTYGAFQGEQITPALAASGVWNTRFDGMPVVRPEAGPVPQFELDGGLRVTVLGPTQAILGEFISEWAKEIRAVQDKWDDALPGIVEQRVGAAAQTFGGRQKPTAPRLETPDDLKALADRDKNKTDTKPANGSSICLVLEYEGTRFLMTGDAHTDNLLQSLMLLREDERRFDLVKMPHHGSAKNVSAELVEALDTPRFLISTSGSYFYHPDAEAIARILYHATAAEPELLFNVKSDFNGWWNNSDWKNMFGYEAVYGSKAGGLTVLFPPGSQPIFLAPPQ